MRAFSVKSGRPCPDCGAPLYFSRDRRTEYCKAPRPDDPLRTCGYHSYAAAMERRWLLRTGRKR